MLHHRGRSATLLTAALLALAVLPGPNQTAASGPPGPPRYPRGTVVMLGHRVVRVTIHNFAFLPARLVVSAGTRVVWTNTDSDPHTVVSAKGLWASEALDTGGLFARVFKSAGAFPYYCGIHPMMRGTVTVVAAATHKP